MHRKSLERLEFLLPYANQFAEELRTMSTVPQDEQLEHISFSLNELVESNVRYADWPTEIRVDPRFHTLIDSFEELKDARNMIVHRSKTLTHDEEMKILNILYEFGNEIEWRIKRAIDILESNEI